MQIADGARQKHAGKGDHRAHRQIDAAREDHKRHADGDNAQKSVIGQNIADHARRGEAGKLTQTEQIAGDKHQQRNHQGKMTFNH